MNKLGKNHRSRRSSKRYWEMTTDELREATREFDKPMGSVPGKPLARADRGLHRRADRQVISVSLDKELLDRVDAVAKKRGVSRATLVEKGLESILVSK